MGDLIFLLLGLSIFGAAFASGGDGDDNDAPEPAEPTLIPLTADEGTFFIRGTGADELLQGTDASEDFFAEGGRDRIEAGDGDDLLEGGDGSDTLFGGAGDDLIRPGDGADVIDAGPGDDSISASTSAGGDTIATGDGADVIDIAFDINDGAAKPAIITDFDPATDTATFDVFAAIAFQLTNPDYPEISLAASAEGTGTELRIDGTPVAIFQGLSPDALTDPDTQLPIDALDTRLSSKFTGAGPQGATPTASDFNDSIMFGDGVDTLFAGFGDDTIRIGDETVFGEDGDDSFFLEGSTAEVFGGPGDDIFDLGFFEPGADLGNTVTLGDGADTVIYAGDGGPPDTAVTITDFDPAEDVLAIDFFSYITDAGPLPPVSFTLELSGDGSATELKLDGETLVILDGLTPADLTQGPGGDPVPALALRVFQDAFDAPGGAILIGSDDADVFLNGIDVMTFLAGAGDDVVFLSGLSETTVDLGAGEDWITIEWNGGNLVTLGTGADMVTIEDPADQTGVTEITDFDPAEDVLVLEVQRLGPALPDVQIELNDDKSATEIRVNGDLYAQLTGLTPDDLIDPFTQQPVTALVLERQPHLAIV